MPVGKLGLCVFKCLYFTFSLDDVELSTEFYGDSYLYSSVLTSLVNEKSLVSSGVISLYVGNYLLSWATFKMFSLFLIFCSFFEVSLDVDLFLFTLLLFGVLPSV